MITFLDGPVAGQTLMLKRIPKLLRVVMEKTGGIDALDQLEDTPNADESIVVYRRRDDLPVSRFHLLCGRKAKTATGWYWNASYSVLPDQPADAEVRTTDAWRAWATKREAAHA